MKKLQKGLTLIELMIVVAIVGILVTIAVPAYQDYVVRARVTEGLSLASAAQTTVVENAVNGAPLAQGYTAPTATKTVSSIAINDAGTITITYTPLAKGVVLTLTPTSGDVALTAGTVPSDSIVWKCAVDTAANNPYVPSTCRI